MFRLFEQELTDRRIEQKIFAAQSESGMGPKLHYQQYEWRIEQFIPSRTMNIWEMRNPVIFTEMAK